MAITTTLDLDLLAYQQYIDQLKKDTQKYNTFNNPPISATSASSNAAKWYGYQPLKKEHDQVKMAQEVIEAQIQMKQAKIEEAYKYYLKNPFLPNWKVKVMPEQIEPDTPNEELI